MHYILETALPGNTLEMQDPINGLPFSWYGLAKSVASGNSLIIPNSNDQIHQFSLIDGVPNDQIIFPNVNSQDFGSNGGAHIPCLNRNLKGTL